MNILTATVIVCGLLGLWAFVRALVMLGRSRYVGAAFRLVLAIAFIAVGACAVLVGQNLLTYSRLTHETPAAKVTFAQTAPQRFSATIAYPDHTSQQLALEGDEWQVDARVIKWRAWVNLIGFDSAFRLERIAGRYTDVQRERTATHTVYALAPDERVNAWAFARKYKEWLPWVDTYYGSATYMPMADGAQYALSVTQSGLLARPLNAAAQGAVSTWR